MIYCVEDDDNIRELVIYTLETTGLKAKGFADGSAFMEALAFDTPELILLDIMLPGDDGLELLKKLKSSQKTRGIPVIMVTAKGSEYDKVVGLDSGADDYVTKPFGMMELVSRIKAVLRRSGGPSEPDILEAGGVRLSLSRGTVWASGRTAELTRNELKILAHLMAHAGEIVSRADLIEALWDSRIYIDDNTLSVNVTRLRNKLGELGLPEQIKTRRGMGYQYDDR